ncbi:MAG: universal stress protein [Deltaproteobacteria bacterium]|nr:universal stress protein [Deltaproteobacteria bacterium]MBW2660608.1 universal stress protein [Deltaproteobacteria bacterium]
MDVKKIVYATNLSKPTFRVLDGLSGLKSLGLQEIVLLCAIGKEGGSEWNRSKNAAFDLFETWKKRLDNLEINVSIRIEPENLSASVLKTIQGNKISLVVLHFNKKENRRILGGSTLNDIIKSTNVPLLVVDKNEKGLNFSSKGIFEHVLFATDWSPKYEKMLRHILNFKELISELELVNVIFEKLSLRNVQQLMEHMINNRKMCLKLGVSTEYHMYAGEISEEILRAAHEYESTVIVMGPTRKRKFNDIFSGRPAYKVIEKTLIPVLLVP